ncbi:hypothetical protein SAMN05428974_0616 [Sphingopyxis sp. YR583]|uniref:DUF6088 family protein n=1 Tax=Sphingopyxis sp. YR583 TaxID=1881047 RepID=UPI0008A80D76|nr:DUF6088 family protein [Sphingopyxis sp. YR583]SEH12975.1 hypothetical protein SAMN05428974_0616 [Sphingopyxis sp. YR583]
MAAIADRIMRRVRGKGRGWAFTPKNFIDMGSRASIDMALSRLVQAGDIRRIGRGLYDYPRHHAALGALGPDPSSLAAALSVQSGELIAPSGAAASNSFGLSAQVPARPAYATTGRSRTRAVAGRTVSFRHSRTPVINHASEVANAALQALAHLGKNQVDDDVIGRLAARLGDKDISDLLRARPQMSGWMGDVILKIAATRHG